MYAASVGNLQRLNFIGGLGARVNMATAGLKLTALHYASSNGHTECVRSLCDRGAMTNAQHGYGSTALHWACDRGHLDVVRLLCERGAQIDLQSHAGYTALLHAVRHNEIDIARYMCERGADTLLKGGGRTPYETARDKYGTDSPIALLLKSYIPH